MHVARWVLRKFRRIHIGSYEWVTTCVAWQSAWILIARLENGRGIGFVGEDGERQKRRMRDDVTPLICVFVSPHFPLSRPSSSGLLF